MSLLCYSELKAAGVDGKFQCLSLVQREKIQQLNFPSLNEEKFIQCACRIRRLFERFLFPREANSLHFSVLNTGLINNRNNESCISATRFFSFTQNVL